MSGMAATGGPGWVARAGYREARIGCEGGERRTANSDVPKKTTRKPCQTCAARAGFRCGRRGRRRGCCPGGRARAQVDVARHAPASTSTRRPWRLSARSVTRLDLHHAPDARDAEAAFLAVLRRLGSAFLISGLMYATGPCGSFTMKTRQFFLLARRRCRCRPRRTWSQ